ncbi:hypothetical protein L1987_14645 [Smallanthus sonchifolius]|uniref:Uncharacterized protein n=1 Tax=Smallanthus sonchifolius TaxID=185202 RepID=A0ACB9J3X8_9ASTR|nr:hypothetical protein L1987_14645 [Smallanthus sonchifolius]
MSLRSNFWEVVKKIRWLVMAVFVVYLVHFPFSQCAYDPGTQVGSGGGIGGGWDRYGNVFGCWVGGGFGSWLAVEPMRIYSNGSRKKGEDLLKEAQSIQVDLKKQPINKKRIYNPIKYLVRLAKGLLNGGLPFRGHDESEKSLYRGHFIDFLKLLGEINEEIEEVLKKIFEELGDDVFSILVDESRDISKKEQMVVVLRYVDKLGLVKERFIGLVHVMAGHNRIIS